MLTPLADRGADGWVTFSTVTLGNGCRIAVQKRDGCTRSVIVSGSLPRPERRPYRPDPTGAAY